MRRADGKIDMCHGRLKVKIIHFKISNVRFLQYGDGTMNEVQVSANNCRHSSHLDITIGYPVKLGNPESIGGIVMGKTLYHQISAVCLGPKTRTKKKPRVVTQRKTKDPTKQTCIRGIK